MPTLDTTPGTHVLFFDMAEFQHLHGVRRTVVEAGKHPLNPVLPLGPVGAWDSVKAAPWETRTVIYDEEDDLFKAWYGGIDLDPAAAYMTGYATSHDGVRWHKPELGLFEYAGSRANNICHQAWGCVVKDGAEPEPSRRYKMIVKGPGFPKSMGGTGYGPVRLNYSADGIHWTDGPRLHLPEWKGRNPDVVLFLRDDQEPDPGRRFKYVWQSKAPANKPGPETVRVKHLAWSPDAIEWTACPHDPFLHPNDSTEQENHFLMLIPYRGWTVMLYEYGWYTPEVGDFEHGYCSDVRLAASRDGVHFTRIEPCQRTIPRGGSGDWDAGLIVIADKAVVRDDTIYLYYAGNGEECDGWFRRKGIRPSRMGLATLGLDRFTCLETSDRDSHGHAVTVPMTVRDAARARLVLNVGETRPQRSWLEVDVLDAATDRPVDGYHGDDCVAVSDEGLRVPARWRRHDTLVDVACERIRLRFRLYGGVRLYSFRFGEPG